jgi:hypothetical protein
MTPTALEDEEEEEEVGSARLARQHRKRILFN